jgi:2-oxoglutarate ferredoxin oxidoreductase subunit alpha
MKYTIVFGGKAGQGVNFLADIVSLGLIEKGYYVFYSRDYQSLIRGGHNFNTLTFSDVPVHSNKSKIDMLVCFDQETKKIHSESLAKNGIVINGEQHGNMYYAAAIYRMMGIDFKILEKEISKLKRFEDNIREAKAGYENEKRSLNLINKKKINSEGFLNGSQALAKGAIISGLDFYYAYPMTPATPLMMELGGMMLDKNNKHKVIELENEIAVMLGAIGSSAIGKKAMVGTSGGGFDLMTEGLSFAGQAEIPLVIYLSERPGPGTGVATYSSQGDLNLALHSGHGEFQRIVIAPASVLECKEAVNHAFYFSQKYRIPAIILGDKDLAESKELEEGKIKLMQIKNAITKPERFNSYERDSKKDNIATEDAEVIKANFDRRIKKQKEIENEAKKFEMFRVYGNEKSKNIVLGFGSTRGAIIDAIKEGKIDAKFIQIIFMDPFPAQEIKKELEKAKKILIVENNSTSQLARLVAEKTGIIIDDKNKILRYDGRPFFSDELAEELARRMK